MTATVANNYVLTECVVCKEYIEIAEQECKGRYAHISCLHNNDTKCIYRHSE